MERREELEVLAAPTCACGRPKTRRRAVCLACWERLPAGLRPDLYLPVGKGFGPAYEKALTHLMGSL